MLDQMSDGIIILKRFYISPTLPVDTACTWPQMHPWSKLIFVQSKIELVMVKPDICAIKNRISYGKTRKKLLPTK